MKKYTFQFIIGVSILVLGVGLRVINTNSQTTPSPQVSSQTESIESSSSEPKQESKEETKEKIESIPAESETRSQDDKQAKEFKPEASSNTTQKQESSNHSIELTDPVDDGWEKVETAPANPSEAAG
jgi:cytoskeletal protein RodZ